MLDFIGIGGQRCGSTWISWCLRDHPDICFAKDKEAYFFGKEYNYSRGIDVYKEQFTYCRGEKIKGEFTTDYYLDSDIAAQIKALFPDVKILVSLRNPADRAFSHYLYRKRKSGSPRSFREVLEEDRKGIIENGYYYKYLKPFLDQFQKERILIVIHDEHEKDPQAFISQFYRFLGVWDDFVPPELYGDINRSKNLTFWFPPFEWLIARRNDIKHYRFGFWLIQFLKRVGVGRLIVKLRNANHRDDREEIEFLLPEERAKLMERYKEDINSLEEYLGRSLSLWRNAT